MEKEKKSLVKWIKEHKTQLIIAGISITTIVAIILGIKNRQTLEEAWSSLKRVAEKVPDKSQSVCKCIETVQEVPKASVTNESIIQITRIPHDVSEHVRNLPSGYKASAEKLALAAERGLDLLPGQIIVEAYRTGGFAA